MELTPLKFLLLFLLLAVVGYVVFTCTARLVAWVVSRMIGGTVRFRIAGINGIKEISIDLHKGPVAYLTVSELKVSVKKPPGTTGWNILSWSSKLQLIISDVEVVLRKHKSSRPRGKKRHRHNSTGRGIWMVVTNVAKYLSVSVNEIAVKTTATITLDVKELEVDTFRDDAAVFSLGVKFYLAPIVLYLGEDKRLTDAPGIFRPLRKIEANGDFYFSLEHLSVSGIIDHDREAGMVIKQLEAGCGEAILNISAESMPRGPLETVSDTDPQEIPHIENHESREIHPEYEARILARKVPEAINFSLPKFTIEAKTSSELASFKNEIKGIFLHGSRSSPLDNVGVISLLDIEVDLGEIHVFQDEESSVLDIMKVSVNVSVEFPTQLVRPLRVEVDVKLGGTQVNLHMSRYDEFMQLKSFRPVKKKRRSSSTAPTRKMSISWSCSISAPEMAIFFYSLERWAFMHVFSQTSHLYINIIPSHGVVVHAELGELYLNRIEKGMRVPTEFLVGVEGGSGCVLHLSRIAVDSGVEGAGETPAVTVEAGATEVYIGMLNIKAALFALASIKSCLKDRRTGTTKEKERHKRGTTIKLQLEQLVFHLEEQMHVEDSTVSDPKKVNFGSQGGIVIITKQEDNLRTARVKPVAFNQTSSSGVKQKLTVTFSLIVVSLDREKKTTLLELESGRMLYEEVGADEKNVAEKTLLAMHAVKLIHRPAKLANDVVMHFLLSARNVSLHWDPDVHLFFYQLSLGVKELLRNRGAAKNPKKAATSKSKAYYAVDIEDMNINAELADGVEGSVHIQSLFSEDAVVGMLFETVEVAFNKAAVARIDRLQVSRVPSLLQEQDMSRGRQLWDIVIHGAGVLIIMPYRLPLRAIDDAVEDTWRGLKLAMVAKRISMRRTSMPEFSKPKDRPSFQLHSMKLHVRGIKAEIEEEPLQGWLDEHHLLLQQQCRVLLVREKLLEESYAKVQLTKQEKRKMWEQLQEQSFQEYRRACSKLIPSRGSGACGTGFQAKFRTSVRRASLMSISAETLDFTLTRIKGGRSGMIEAIRRLDCVQPDVQVPFSRLYGGHVIFGMTSLAICLRDYTPMLSASSGRCEGIAIFAQQATCFQKQMVQHLYVGRWRAVEMLRSMSGTTPSYKFYSELPIEITTAKVCYGVGFEPAFADVSYAFTVALRRYNLSVREELVHRPPLVKKEKNLPWWDDMRYYVHGFNSITVSNFEWNFLATTDPYETQNRMHMISSTMVISQAEGSLSFQGDNFDMYISSWEALEKQHQFIHAPVFQLVITMDWTCASGAPLFHYLHAFPIEQRSRELVYDPFRSLSLSLIWSFSLQTYAPKGESGISMRRNRTGQKFSSPSQLPGSCRVDVPYMNLSAQDLMWVFKWWNLYYSPPHKLRSFSRWPRFGVERLPRSGNLSLDKVLTEFILRVDSTPAFIRHTSVTDDDPAEGLTFSMQKLRYELCYSRGLQRYTFETKRDILDLVYQGLDVHLLKTKLKALSDSENGIHSSAHSDKLKEDGFLLSTDCFTLRRQSPKADTARLSPWRENVQVRGSGHYRLSDSENDPPDATSSDPSDDDGLNAVLADNCLRVSLYSLKLFWTVCNRDAVWAWVGDISKAFEAPKPSPSRQYAQRKLVEEKQKATVLAEQGAKAISSAPSQESMEINFCFSEMLRSRLKENVEEEETLQFMVNVIQPQFNLHSEDAHGRFLLAAASGRVLARSFHSTFYVGLEELLQQALGPASFSTLGSIPELSWKRRELSVLLEHVQAHVAPTDVDPGAGIQWLPRIPRGAVKVKRTGALLERVFLPCSMYFQYIRHKGGSTDCKAKALKDLSFNSPNITATMTSRQFHIMVDVLSSLLFATLPKPRKREEEEDVVEEADEVVPEGVEEVELARIKLEQADRDMKLISDDLKIIRLRWRTAADGGASPDQLSLKESPENSLNRALTTSGLLESELVFKKKERKVAYTSVRSAMHRAAQQEREKNKIPSAAMRISWAIDKVVWSMLSDGDTFAEAEISSMILNVDRDFNNVGVARFTTKSFVVKNCVRLAKSNVLSAWNPPAEWGRNVMLRVDAKQGPPREGLSLLEMFQVEIYPLRIHLTEVMYTMMWEYFFPGDEQDPQKRQEVWNSGTKRSKKGVAVFESTKEPSVSKTSAPGTPPTLHGGQALQRSTAQARRLSSANGLHSQCSFCSPLNQSKNLLEHQRSASLDKFWGEKDTEGFTSELVLFSNSNAAASDDALAATSAVVEVDITKSKDARKARTGKAPQEDKKEAKSRKIFLEIHNIKISQVELLVTYEGSKISVSELRLLMDMFTRTEFTGSWRRLFSSVKKHIIWGVLKSVTGMQGKKFKDKMQAQAREPFQDSDSNSSDSGITSKISTKERFPIPIPHFSSAGEGFVSSIRGLFNSQRKNMVRKIRGEENQHEWSDGELASRATHKGKTKLLRRHSKKRASISKGSIILGERYCPSPRASSSPYHSDGEASSGGSSTYEDFDTS
ncbi:hypothetical protein SELMODRAFT_146641 [Selaginella moellendorffii]|uniref:Uncharacterized protein KIP-1 n=1 Tax=Selaginella moellendorffii TaxID=88036 RepID=D8RF88_SELML|nr:hypothetical protein SELMODRAFT_146641 [Selaginella moellendorffii]